MSGGPVAGEWRVGRPTPSGARCGAYRRRPPPPPKRACACSPPGPGPTRSVSPLRERPADRFRGWPHYGWQERTPASAKGRRGPSPGTPATTEWKQEAWCPSAVTGNVRRVARGAGWKCSPGPVGRRDGATGSGSRADRAGGAETPLHRPAGQYQLGAVPAGDAVTGLGWWKHGPGRSPAGPGGRGHRPRRDAHVQRDRARMPEPSLGGRPSPPSRS